MSKQPKPSLTNLAKGIGMKLLFDIERSLNVNPPKYGKGVKWIERRKVKLSDLITKDDEGNSLQSREKEHVIQDHNDLKNSFMALGVLYDKEVMVCRLRDDGLLELNSGYNRLWVLTTMGITHYFVDVVTYDNPYFEAMWKRKFNASQDHLGKGTPNTEGTLLLGLSEAKAKDSFDWKSDDAVKEALRFMTSGSKTEGQITSLLKKWRETNNPNPFVRGLNTQMANKLSEHMELSYKGYCKDASLECYGEIGYNRHDGDIRSKIVEWVNLYNSRGVKIDVYGFIQHVVADKIDKQRKEFVDEFNASVEWMKKHLQPKYHNIVNLAGFHAQIRTRNSKDGGRPKERGIVDVNGNIIIDKDPILGTK